VKWRRRQPLQHGPNSRALPGCRRIRPVAPVLECPFGWWRRPLWRVLDPAV
jgi:hypothetical protein